MVQSSMLCHLRILVEGTPMLEASLFQLLPDLQFLLTCRHTLQAAAAGCAALQADPAASALPGWPDMAAPYCFAVRAHHSYSTANLQGTTSLVWQMAEEPSQVLMTPLLLVVMCCILLPWRQLNEVVTVACVVHG